MPQNLDAVDLKFTADGDYTVGENGDLADTSGDEIESVIDQIFTEMASDKGDWSIHSSIGAGLEEFLGEPNTAEVGAQIERRIIDALTRTSIGIPRDDLFVRVVPMDLHSILISIRLAVQSTSNNSVEDNTLVVSFLFDLVERGVTPLIADPIQNNSSSRSL